MQRFHALIGQKTAGRVSCVKEKKPEKFSCVKERKNSWQSVICHRKEKLVQNVMPKRNGTLLRNCKNIYNRKIRLLVMCLASNIKFYLI